MKLLGLGIKVAFKTLVFMWVSLRKGQLSKGVEEVRELTM